jgi:hypothetical protein
MALGSCVKALTDAEIAHVGIKVVGGKEHGKEDDHAPVFNDLPHAGNLLLKSRLGLDRN